jgi:hypothetical protein
MKTEEQYLPYPDTCPYHTSCPTQAIVEEEVAKQDQQDAILCTDLNYTRCPMYATLYKNDWEAAISNGAQAAIAEHLAMCGLEQNIVIMSGVEGEDLTKKVEGFK